MPLLVIVARFIVVRHNAARAIPFLGADSIMQLQTSCLNLKGCFAVLSALTLLGIAVASHLLLRQPKEQAWPESGLQDLEAQLAQEDPEAALAAFDQLLHGSDLPLADLSQELRRRTSVADLFEGGAAGVPAGRRGRTILRAAEATLPRVRERPEEFRLLASVLWALDSFSRREDAHRPEAIRLRQALLDPLWSMRSPPLELDESHWAMIPEGVFEMGSEGGSEDEQPRRRVSIPGFRLLRHEVTNGELRRLVPEHAAGEPGELPAVNVSWALAYVYSAWLGGRLPTEAEWEYAASGGCGFDFCDRQGGETSLEKVGFFDENSGGALQEGRRKEPNPFGLYDMHGNAFERVADWYDAYDVQSVFDPWGPPKGVARGIRGGAFSVGKRWAYRTFRVGRSPDLEMEDQGFRVALSAPTDQ